MTGFKVARVTVLGKSSKLRNGVKGLYWDCLCICGNRLLARGSELRRGTVKSCGCQRIDSNRMRFYKHGHAFDDGTSGIYRVWASMRARCSNPNVIGYHNYGGRGIKVCERWNDFRNFLADMGDRPEGLTLDRIDVNGNYEPSNCRWLSRREQALNSRPRKRIDKWTDSELIGELVKRGYKVKVSNYHASP